MSKKYNDLMPAMGEPETITLDGKEFKVYPPTIEDMASLFSFVKKNQKQEREELLQTYLKAAKQAEIAPLDQITTIDSLVHDIVIDTTDLLNYMDDVENIQYLLWLCLKKKSGSKLKFEDVGNLVLNTQLPKIKLILVELMFGSAVVEEVTGSVEEKTDNKDTEDTKEKENFPETKNPKKTEN